MSLRFVLICGAFLLSVRVPAAVLAPADRVAIAAQRAAGVEQVVLAIAAQPGATPALARSIEALGGEVRSRDDAVDYLLVSVALSSLERVLTEPAIEAVQADLGLVVQFGGGGAPDGRGSESPPRTVPLPLPSDNPYTALKATGALPFREAFPTYDGRGVVIGAIEPADLGMPALRHGRDLAGNVVPKFADFSVDGSFTEGKPGEQEFKAKSTLAVEPDHDGRIHVDGDRYRVPSAWVKEELRFMVHRSRSGESYALLWAVAKRSVRVCVGSARDFGQGVGIDLHNPLKPRGWVVFGLGDSTALRPAMVVTADEFGRRLAVSTTFAPHGTMCTSVAAGHDFGNVAAGGVAPGAQLAIHCDYHRSGEPSVEFESLLAAIRDPQVDLVTLSTGIANPMGAGQSVYSILLRRALVKDPKLIFCFWGNSGMKEEDPWLSQLDEIIAVGAYAPQETLLSNYGIDTGREHTAAGFSLHGPALDGGLKPDLLALSGTLCGAQAKRDRGGLFLSTPPGTMVSSGTSSAAPHAAGHAALLISAARQSGLPHDAARLRAAMISTCEFLDGIPAHVQGHGLVQVERAWDRLRRLATFTPPTFRTEAPVRHAWSALLDHPHVGRGLFEVGWHPGEKGTRKITLTRISGPAGAANYRLRWKGDRAAFTVREHELSLPLGVPVQLEIAVTAPRLGKASAILDLIDPANELIAHSVLCTVVAAEQLEEGNGYRAVVRGRAERPGNAGVYVNVPPGTSALRIQLRQEHGRIRLHAQGPDRRVDEDWGFAVGYSREKEIDATLRDPLPGIWRLWVDNSAYDYPTYYDVQLPRPAPDCEFELTVIALGAETRQVTADRVEFKHLLGTPTDPRLKGGALGEAQTDSFLLQPGLAGRWFELEVPAGSERVIVEMAGPGVSNTSASLLLFQDLKHPSGGWTLAAYRRTAGLDKRIDFRNPKPGRYKVCIDPWDLPAGGVDVRYRAAVFHPKFGQVTVSEVVATGITTRATLASAPAPVPVAGRTKVAAVDLFAAESRADRFLGLNEQPSGNRPTDGLTSSVEKSVPLATSLIPIPEPASR